MKVILLFSLIFTSTFAANLSYALNGSVPALSPTPSPPIYPPRWTATARFEFTNMSTGLNAGAGILYQVIDSINKKFRADDLYFAGTFPAPYDTLLASSDPVDAYQYYASLTPNGISCVVYPGKPTTLSQNWIAELCTYNSTLYYNTTEAYRWNCATDIVTWFLDTSASDGRLIYQHTYPQPLFDVYQDLWFTDYNEVKEKFDQAIFIPPKGWNCPTSQSVKHTFCMTFLCISILVYALHQNYINQLVNP